MMDQKIPIPVRDGLFTCIDGKTQLIVSKCIRCGELIFPKQAFCPECCTETMEKTTIGSTGKLKSFTEISAPPPNFKGNVPYTVGVVEFSEGIRIMGITTETTVKNLSEGMKMEIIVDTAFIENEKEYVTYKFKPVM